MGFQGDPKAFISEDGDKIIIQCMCGMGVHHGGLEIQRSDDPRDEFHGWVTLTLSPLYGLKWYQTFFIRLKMAWDLLLGRHLFIDMEWNRPTCLALAGWLNDEPRHDLKSGRQIIDERVKEMMDELRHKQAAMSEQA